jgi:hypothetical protein
MYAHPTFHLKVHGSNEERRAVEQTARALLPGKSLPMCSSSGR